MKKGASGETFHVPDPVAGLQKASSFPLFFLKDVIQPCLLNKIHERLIQASNRIDKEKIRKNTENELLWRSQFCSDFGNLKHTFES